MPAKVVPLEADPGSPSSSGSLPSSPVTAFPDTPTGELEKTKAKALGDKEAEEKAARKAARAERKARIAELMNEFGELRTADGLLNFKHFAALLLRRIPPEEAPDELQLRTMFEMVDKDKKGKIDFHAFADFVLDGLPKIPNVAAPEPVKKAFLTRSNSGAGLMSSSQFGKMCAEVGILDKKFRLADADTIFTKATDGAKGGKLDMHKFELALIYIASKKGKSVRRVQAMVAPEIDEEGVASASAEAAAPEPKEAAKEA